MNNIKHSLNIRIYYWFTRSLNINIYWRNQKISGMIYICKRWRKGEWGFHNWKLFTIWEKKKGK